MALFRKKKSGRRQQRIEPRLIADRRRAPPAERKPPRGRRSRSLFGAMFSFFLTAAMWGTVAAAVGFGYIWMSLDRKGLLRIPDREPGIMLLASDGSVLAQQGSFFGDEVRLGELPDYVSNAVVAIEDRRFRSHFGVDPIGLVRAMITNLRAGHIVQGGSTLTQQLAKNLFLEPDRTMERKVQEMVLAIWLETKFTKDEILQLYLNRVYYGSGATGIEKAAEVYFNKSARELTLSEAATLAGLLKAPYTYSPKLHADAAAERARLVIRSMVDGGFISQEEATAAASAPAAVQGSDYVASTQYIVDWVSEQLPQLVKKYDQSIVVQTTIDPHLQTVAERSLRKRLNDEGAKLDTRQGALVTMDMDGAIRVLVGGKSYKRSQFNRVTKAKRQPGSAFKPFVYLAAVERGYTPDSVEVDEPVRIGNWEPENYKHKYLGQVTLRTAFALSLNTIAVRLASYVGPQNVVAVAHRLGITSELGNDASISLGTSEVTPLEMTAAFVPFANGGRPVIPYVVSRITTRDGALLYERQGSGLNQAVASQYLAYMNDMLHAVVTEGTAKRAAFGGFEIGGKTGTSQDYRDAWFIGFTSYLVTGVWLGNDDSSPTLRVTGGSIPAEIWKDVMQEAHAGLAPRPLPGERESPPETGALADLLDPGSAGQSVQQPIERRPLSELAPTPRKHKGLFDSFGDIFSSGNKAEQPSKKHRKKSIFDYL
jgi:penicillin-binding protein 1A